MNENNQAQAGEPGILREALKVLRNSSMTKYCHYHAADRYKILNVLFGLPALFISLFLGSVFFYTLGQELPVYAKWIGGILGFLAASLTMFQTFFNFSHNFESHRRLANQYLEIERRCALLIRQYDDQLVDLLGFNKQIEIISKDYMDLNRDAEKYPTNDRDFEFAKNKHKNWKGIGVHGFRSGTQNTTIQGG